MIRIVDENELRSLTEKSVEPPKRPDIHAQLSKLKDILAAKEAEIERLRSGGDISQAKADARQDIISKETRERDEEIVRMKDRHVRDVEIIAHLHDNIDELKVQIEGLRSEVLDLRRGQVAAPQQVQPVVPQPVVQQATRPTVPQQPQPVSQQIPQQAVVMPPPRPEVHTATFIESQPGNEPPLERRPAEEEYRSASPVVHPPTDPDIIRAEQVPYEGQVQDAVVIPLDGEETPEGTPTIKYRPLD